MAGARDGPGPAGAAGQAPLLKAKVSVSQLRILLMAVEHNPSLYNASESDMVSYINIDKWMKLADKLNECMDGTLLNTQNWKYVLRYWADNVKKGVNVMSKERLALNKSNPAITLKEAKELTRLERRFYKFMKEEEAKAIVDETNPAEKVERNINIVAPSPLTVNDENACPEGPKKRTMEGHVNEDDPIDPADVTKKVKITLDDNLDEQPHEHVLENQLDRLQMVSRELEDHIASIQSRIYMIKDLWKHHCGDN